MIADFKNTYLRLPESFYRRVSPTPLPDPYLVAVNPDALALLDLTPEVVDDPEFVELFSGTRVPAGGEPVAMCYAGHQFGHYVPRLGDGRAILLGEAENRRGECWEVQLKGAGQTPYSRDGDGRAVLRSTIREYLCGEAMHGLGIPTTRALCIVGSDEEVYREQIESAAVLTRLAPTHVRFGTFEYFFHSGDYRGVWELANWLLTHHFQQVSGYRNPYLEMLREIVVGTARLVARWQLVGFAHGVLNTDNMSVLGLTLDYGPFGFLDRYRPDFICNHSDRSGRYAFDAQPRIALWNLSCLAQAMLPLLHADDGEAAAALANEALADFEGAFMDTYLQGARDKLGLVADDRRDPLLFAELLRSMAENRVDHTRFFRALSRLSSGDDDAAASDAAAEFADPSAFAAWAEGYRQRLRAEHSDDAARRRAMERVNPKYILRNYLAEQAIEQVRRGDYGEIERLRALLARPFDEQPENEAYAAPPPAWASRIEVSCSS